MKTKYATEQEIEIGMRTVPAIKEAVAALLEARKAADDIRPIVQEYQNRFAVQLGYESYEQLSWDDEADEAFARCVALCKEERQRLNLPVEAEDNCPLLEAESKIRNAERAVLESLKPFTGLGWSDWFRSIDCRKKAIDCCVRLCQN